MSQKVRTRLGVIKQFKARQLSLVAAAQLMTVSYRQAKRVWRRYQDEGDAGLSGTNLLFSGTGGIPTATFIVLASSTITLAVGNWSVLGTNAFDSNGAFAWQATFDPNTPRQFYRLRLQLLVLP